MLLIFAAKVIASIAKWTCKIGVIVALVFAMFVTYQVVYPRVMRLWESAESELRQVDELKSSDQKLTEKIGQARQQIEDTESAIDELRNAEENAQQSIEQKIKKLGEVVSAEFEKQKSKLETRLKEMDNNIPSHYFSWPPYFKRAQFDAERAVVQKELAALKMGEVALNANDPLRKRIEQIVSDKQKHQGILEELANSVSNLSIQLDDVRARIGLLTSSPSLQAEVLIVWRKFRPWIIYFALGIAVGPWLTAFIMYYGVGSLVKVFPAQAFHRDGNTGLYWSESKSTFDIRLQPGEKLWVRSKWLTQHDGSHKQTNLWWNFRALAISYIAELVPCTRVTNRSPNSTRISIASADSSIEIAEIALDTAAEIILHPRHIVGIQGEVGARAEWRLLSPHAWLTGQVRYLVFTGPGSIYVAGPRGVEGFYVEGDKPERISQDRVVGFDTRLRYSVDRTETFWPYLVGKATLFDDCFKGEGTILRQHAVDKTTKTVVEQTVGVLISALGKLLGF